MIRIYGKIDRPKKKSRDSIMVRMFKTIFNLTMIAMTGGLWIFWLMYKSVKKRRRA